MPFWDGLGCQGWARRGQAGVGVMATPTTMPMRGGGFGSDAKLGWTGLPGLGQAGPGWGGRHGHAHDNAHARGWVRIGY